MTVRRSLVAIPAVVLLLGLGALGVACSTKTTLRKAAIGTWDCVPPKSAKGVKPLRVTVKDGGAFTVDYKRGSGEAQTITGGWNLNGSKVDITFTGVAAIVPPIQVKGATEDATDITLHSIGGDQKDTRTIVKRTGWDKVTFRNDAPGAVTFTCTKK